MFEQLKNQSSFSIDQQSSNSDLNFAFELKVCRMAYNQSKGLSPATSSSMAVQRLRHITVPALCPSLKIDIGI